MTEDNPAVRIGTRLVDLCNAGNSDEALDTLYDEKIVSIEGQGSDEMPARMEGIEAIRGKNAWWFDNHEVHSMTATGPFVGHRDDQFVVGFDIDVTFKPTGERSQLSEVGIYTVAHDKVVQEEFFYRTR